MFKLKSPPQEVERTLMLNFWVSYSRAHSSSPGARPERLPVFDEECWQLMEACWNGDPLQRPLLGIVEPSLQSIMDRLCNYGSEQKSSSLEDSNWKHSRLSCDRDQKSIFVVFMQNGGEQKMSAMRKFCPSCLHRCGIYVIYEELLQTRHSEICVFYCLCVVYLYTNYTMLLS